ncbi:MAG TPA: glycosyltransferase family 4 protein [Solirubrobacteraceae bacterium]|nr:glycosyltransferase family 4 protein [Solirubrobacteraceae bacterium]
MPSASSTATARPVANTPSPASRQVTIVAHDVGSVGGMERVLAELAVGLQARGHEVTVIARKCVLPAGCGVTFHRVRGPSRPLIVAHPWFMLFGTLALRRRRRGVVQATGAIVLGHVDVIAVHYCHQVGPVNPSSASLPFKLHAIAARRLKRATERMCYRPQGADAFVCVSEGVAEEVRAYFPALAGRVHTIYNGVDTDVFAPGVRERDARELRAQLGIGAQAPVAAFVGSEWARKGLAEVISALALTSDWELLIAGSGERERYQELADSLGVGARVHFLGVTSDVQLVYQAADAFVLPTSYETFSLVSFEAAASGLPVLATSVNGVRELIEDGRNGFLIGRDPQEIAARLAQLAAEPALRAAMGRAARESALRFSWEQMVLRHAELYARLRAPAAAPADR